MATPRTVGTSDRRQLPPPDGTRSPRGGTSFPLEAEVNERSEDLPCPPCRASGPGATPRSGTGPWPWRCSPWAWPGSSPCRRHSKQFPDPLWANYAFLLAGALPLGFRRKAQQATVAVLVVAAFTAWSISICRRASRAAGAWDARGPYILGAGAAGGDTGRRRLHDPEAGCCPSATATAPGTQIPALVFIGLAWTVGYVLRRRRERLAGALPGRPG